MCYFYFAGVLLSKRWDRAEVLDCSSKIKHIWAASHSSQAVTAPLGMGATCGEKQTVVSLHGDYSTSHTLESSCVRMGLGKVSLPYPALLCGTLKTGHPANKVHKQPSGMHRGRGNSRNFSGEMGFHGNCSHVSWAKWGLCRRLQKTLNLSSQLETEATGKRYPLLGKPEFTLAFPVSSYNNKLLPQSQVLPGMAHYPHNKTKPKKQMRKLTGSALWKNWELLCTGKFLQNKDWLKFIWNLHSILVSVVRESVNTTGSVWAARVSLHFLTQTWTSLMFSHILSQTKGSCSCSLLSTFPSLKAFLLLGLLWQNLLRHRYSQVSSWVRLSP